MTHAIFPLAFANDDIRLLTAIVLGFLFGFSLERGGFGNARKLAAQFYLYDMAVFKVMFTAIIVAMVGLFTLANLGWVDLDMLYINPTFMWAQVVGGFLLGIGFLMSGLCPGTSVVSSASGRWDGFMAFLGITFGALVFMLAVQWVPGLEALYHAGSMGTVLLSDVLHVSPLVVALAVVVMAALGFIGAEKVEHIFQRKYGMVELTRPQRPTGKFVLVGAVALVAIVGLGLPTGPTTLPPARVASLAPLALAQDIIEGRPGLLILDLRSGAAADGGRIPHAYPATDPETASRLLASVPEDGTVVLVDDDGKDVTVPPAWPRTLHYAYLEKGFQGWKQDVLTPASPGSTLEEKQWAAWHDQITAFFTGTAVAASDVPPPPPLRAGAKKKKKKGSGC